MATQDVTFKRLERLSRDVKATRTKLGQHAIDQQNLTADRRAAYGAYRKSKKTLDTVEGMLTRTAMDTAHTGSAVSEIGGSIPDTSKGKQSSKTQEAGPSAEELARARTYADIKSAARPYREAQKQEKAEREQQLDQQEAQAQARYEQNQALYEESQEAKIEAWEERLEEEKLPPPPSMWDEARAHDEAFTGFLQDLADTTTGTQVRTSTARDQASNSAALGRADESAAHQGERMNRLKGTDKDILDVTADDISTAAEDAREFKKPSGNYNQTQKDYVKLMEGCLDVGQDFKKLSEVGLAGPQNPMGYAGPQNPRRWHDYFLREKGKTSFGKTLRIIEGEKNLKAKQAHKAKVVDRYLDQARHGLRAATELYYKALEEISGFQNQNLARGGMLADSLDYNYRRLSDLIKGSKPAVGTGLRGGRPTTASTEALLNQMQEAARGENAGFNAWRNERTPLQNISSNISAFRWSGTGITNLQFQLAEFFDVPPDNPILQEATADPIQAAQLRSKRINPTSEQAPLPGVPGQHVGPMGRALHSLGIIAAITHTPGPTAPARLAQPDTTPEKEAEPAPHASSSSALSAETQDSRLGDPSRPLLPGRSLQRPPEPQQHPAAEPSTGERTNAPSAGESPRKLEREKRGAVGIRVFSSFLPSDTAVDTVPDNWGGLHSTEDRAMEAARFVRGLLASNYGLSVDDLTEKQKKAAEIANDILGYAGLDDLIQALPETLRTKAKDHLKDKLEGIGKANFIVQLTAIALDVMASRQSQIKNKNITIEKTDTWNTLVNKGMDPKLREAGISPNTIPGLPWLEQQIVKKFGALAQETLRFTDEINRRLFSFGTAYRSRQLIALHERIPEDVKAYLADKRPTFKPVLEKADNIKLDIMHARMARFDFDLLKSKPQGSVARLVLHIARGAHGQVQQAVNTLAWATSYEHWEREVTRNDIATMKDAVKAAYNYDKYNRRQIEDFTKGNVNKTMNALQKTIDMALNPVQAGDGVRLEKAGSNDSQRWVIKNSASLEQIGTIQKNGNEYEFYNRLHEFFHLVIDYTNAAGRRHQKSTGWRVDRDSITVQSGTQIRVGITEVTRRQRQ